VNNEANFVDVAKTLDFAGGNRGQEAEAMRNQLNRLAVEMAGVNEADVMRIAAGGATGGIAKEDLLAYTKDTIMTATAWDMDAESAAENGMALRNSLGYKSGEEDQRRGEQEWRRKSAGLAWGNESYWCAHDQLGIF
jgi:TP901 family phage tail tape measure protein